MNETVQQQDDRLYRTLARVIYLAAGVFLALWFLDAITVVALFFLTAIILAIALNPPVVWLEECGLPRAAGTLLVSLGVALLIGLLGWLVVPRVADQGASLIEQLPEYANTLQERAADLLNEHPELQERLRAENGRFAEQLWPAAQTVLARIGRYSLSAIGVLVFALLLVSTVLYTLARPQPLLKGFIIALPAHLRDPAERAFVKSSGAIKGWLWSNVIVGAIEAVVATIVLSWLGVPGAVVWGALTFFAELVPNLGAYLMSAPPVLVALAVDPMTALWVLLFYIALQQISGNFLMPLVRSSTMNMHPVSLLFAVLALGSVFGLLGALISTPVAGIIKSFYEEFYLAKQPQDENLDKRVDNMLKGGSEAQQGEESPAPSTT